MAKLALRVNGSAREVDSPDPEIYHRIRGGPLEKALRGIANLMAEIDDPLRVSVSSVLMSESVASLVAFPPVLARACFG